MATVYNELIATSTHESGRFRYGLILNRKDKVCFLVSWDIDKKTDAYVPGSGVFLCPCCIQVRYMQKLEEKITELKTTEGLKVVYFDLLIKGGYRGEAEYSPTEAEFAYGEKMKLTHQYARLPICNDRLMACKVYTAMIEAMFKEES